MKNSMKLSGIVGYFKGDARSNSLDFLTADI
jgi:hypothetical protein